MFDPRRQLLNRFISLALLTLMACTQSPEQPAYGEGALPFLVLQEAPSGTFATEDPTHRGLEDVAAGDDVRREIFESAGFVDMYEATFIGSGSRPELEGFLLTSRAYLFENPDAGVDALKHIVEIEGDNQTILGSPVEGRNGFTISGKLDSELPSGTLMVWRKSNVVMAIAAVAAGRIDETYLREIANEVDKLEPVTYP